MSAFTANTNRINIELSGKVVRIYDSEKKYYDFPIEYCSVSEHIVNTLEMSADEELPIMDFPNIKGTVLQLVLNYMEEYSKEPFQPIPKPLPSTGLESILSPYYNNLISMNITGNNGESVSLLEILHAANLLQISSLKQLICAKLADSVKNKNIKDMFNIFGIHDHVPSWSDFERIHQTHSYAFEK